MNANSFDFFLGFRITVYDFKNYIFEKKRKMKNTLRKSTMIKKKQQYGKVERMDIHIVIHSMMYVRRCVIIILPIQV